VLNVHRTTTVNILERVGAYCEEIQAEHMRNLSLTDLEIDEMRTFVKKKQGRLTVEEKRNSTIGDQYLFFAVDRSTKLVPAWTVGKRDMNTTFEFIRNLRRCMNGCQTQISTDCFAPYESAIPAYFGDQASYATVTKIYEQEHIGKGRYAPPRVKSMEISPLEGEPDLDKACTSHIERHKLTIRTFQERLTRLSQRSLIT
jgi:IS1 family transposase